MALMISFAGCGASAATLPPVPGGTYTSQQYQFKVTYPQGWSANVQAQPSQPIPLVLVITRTMSNASAGPAVSTFTVMVFSLRGTNAQAAPAVSGNHDLRQITLGKLRAYTSAPVNEPIQGTNVAVTHTDYFVVSSDYEYQISTDDVHGENATSALTSMLHSFTLMKP